MSSHDQPMQQPSGMSMDTASSNLETLPLEIQSHIFSYVGQREALDLILTSPAVSGAAAIQLYHRPKFQSTYRLAQFVHTISHSERYASLVRFFELPYELEDRDVNNQFASWIEWRYRDVPQFAAGPPPSQDSGFVRSDYQGTHPSRNPDLRKYAASTSLPVGIVMHVLTACTNLRTVSIRLSLLADDSTIVSPAYPATSFTSLIFASDVPRSWSPTSNDVKLITPEAMIGALTNLPQPRQLSIRNVSWLNKGHVNRIVSECSQLEKVDFRDSGRPRRLQNSNSRRIVIHFPRPPPSPPPLPWAIKGSRRKLAKILKRESVAKALQ